MKYTVHLNDLLLSEAGSVPRQLESFSLLSLGIIASLTNGSISPAGAIEYFFHAQNCRFVRKLKNKLADEIMGRGVQLPDLFDVLPTDRARKEFERELDTMRALCLRLLGKRQLVA